MPIGFLKQALYYAVMDRAVKGERIGIPIQSYVEKSSWTYRVKLTFEPGNIP